MRSADFNLGWRSEEIIYMEIFSWWSEVTATASGVPNALTIRSNHWIRTTIVDTIYLKRQSTWHILLARYKAVVQVNQWRAWGKYCSKSTVCFLKTRDWKVLSVAVVTRARVSTEEGCHSVYSVNCIWNHYSSSYRWSWLDNNWIIAECLLIILPLPKYW